ncbi:MAG: hypothetical protein RJA36_1270, partial [Pseudomonadota bacterium]
MRLTGASSASPRAERDRPLRGRALSNIRCRGTLDTSGAGNLSGAAHSNVRLRGQPQLAHPIATNFRCRGTLAILGRIRSNMRARGTLDLTDFAYERDFVLRALSELPAETLTDFVVLGYELAGAWLKTVANGGRIQHASAFDVLLLDAAGSPLDHNVVFYDGTNGVLRLDFRIPTLALGSDFRWRMRYGRSGVSTTYANPAGCFRRALAAWEWSGGLDLTGRNRDFSSISGVTQGQLKGPCGVLAGNSAAVANLASWANGLNAA